MLTPHEHIEAAEELLDVVALVDSYGFPRADAMIAAARAHIAAADVIGRLDVAANVRFERVANKMAADLDSCIVYGCDLPRYHAEVEATDYGIAHRDAS